MEDLEAFLKHQDEIMEQLSNQLRTKAFPDNFSKVNPFSERYQKAP